MSDDKTITLVDCNDAYHFSIGLPIEMTMTSSGALRPSTRLERLASRLKRMWRRITWWRQTRTIVVAIDHEAGSVTMGTLRWSWRKWKWVAL